jgi:hypothetical protein
MSDSVLSRTSAGARQALNHRERAGERYVLKDFRDSSHRILADWVGQLPEGIRILELGPGPAHVALLVGPTPRTWHGLDSEVSCLAALRFVLQGGAVVDLESIGQLPPGYHAMLAADSLEHLADPARLLSMIHAALPAGAPLFISVPNIANIYVRLNLLIGRLPYADRGLLDRSHRVFFTRRWLHELLSEAGFRVVRERVSTIPLPLLWPRLPRRLLDLLLRLLWIPTYLAPTLLGYQILVMAERRAEVPAS